MGKRKKTAKKIEKRVIPKLDTLFDCPFCSHSKTVEVKLDKKSSIAHLSCRICAIHYQMMMNNLTEPVDVYSHWIDECEKKHKEDFFVEDSKE